MKKYIFLILSVFLIFSCNNLNNNGNINNTGANVENNTGDIIQDPNNSSGPRQASNGKISLKYPNNFFDEGKTPQFFSGTCNVNSIENVKNIATGLENFSSGAIETSTKTINGNDWLVLKTQDAGMGKTITTYYYSLFSDNECHIVKLETSLTNCDFYLPLEEGNIEQKNNYDACVSKNENFDKNILEIENSLEFQS